MAPTQPDHQETQPPATPPASSLCLPLPGYRFVPTDCELIREFLQKKVNNEPVPLSDHIKDTYLRLKTPMELAVELPKLGDNEWYFFTPRDRKYPNGQRPDRAGPSGYWKATGEDKDVVDDQERIVGFKQTLVFYEGKPMHGEKTDWILHEFKLNQPPRKKTTPDDMRLDDWVLCRIHKKAPPKNVTVRAAKKRKARTEEEESAVAVAVNGVGVTTNNLDYRDNHDHAQQPIDHLLVNYNSTSFDDQPIHVHVNNSNTAPGQYYSHQQHEQQPQLAGFSSGSGSGSCYGDCCRTDDGLGLVSSHVNPDNEVINGVLSDNSYLNEQPPPVTGFQELLGTSSTFWNDELAWSTNEPFIPSTSYIMASPVADFLQPGNTINTMASSSAAAFLPPWNTSNTMASSAADFFPSNTMASSAADFFPLPPCNTSNTMASSAAASTSSSNASWNNEESAAAAFVNPAYDPCPAPPAPPNINNNSPNYGGGGNNSPNYGGGGGGGKKRSIY